MPSARPNAPNLTQHVLALNSGSSSFKFGLYALNGADSVRLLSGEARGVGSSTSEFQVRDAAGDVLCIERASLSNTQAVVGRIGRLLRERESPIPQAIGHRVVHGGSKLRKHCRMDATVLHELKEAEAFAPLHTTATLACIEAAQSQFPDVPHVACFDTVFHARMPARARTLALPLALREQGIERYGFHGLSCESIVQQLVQKPLERLPSRLLIAHLGNGASVTAVREGVSIDTSMGLTPSGGLIMGSRSGDLDPGVLIYLARERGFDAAMLEDLIDRQSGLTGISGLGGDMRTLHAAAATNAQAVLAIDMFCYTVRKQLAAMWVALDGADAIVFTGGIGENDAAVRTEICTGLSSLGVQLDEARHRMRTTLISNNASSCQVYVLPSLEDEQIARHTAFLTSSI
jgi:acetate kinase